jgi:hypothetical protein
MEFARFGIAGTVILRQYSALRRDRHLQISGLKRWSCVEGSEHFAPFCFENFEMVRQIREMFHFEERGE